MSDRIIVVGASAGGIEALTKLVADLPSDLPASIFVVLHISPNSGSVLPNILSRAGVLPAIHPKHGEVIRSSQIYVAPPDRHLLLKKEHIYLSHGPKENHCRPAIDVLFRTAARNYGPFVIGVVLSGTLDDGTAGLLAIKQRGGVAIVQDPKEALYPGMPISAIENVKVDRVLPISEIAKVLVTLAYEPLENKEIPPVSDDLEQESDIAELEPKAMQSSERVGKPSAFSCPDCGGVLWEIEEGNLIRFRCRTGHAFSPESLLAQQSQSLEEALWTALRALEEIAALRQRMAQRAEKMNHAQRAHNYNEQAKIAKQRALLIRQAILNSTSNNDELGQTSAG
jgi:two-component system, chemotaxis family, protein-glutamate methylesterase/glutaminase